jgi:hypothetical protein
MKKFSDIAINEKFLKNPFKKPAEEKVYHLISKEQMSDYSKSLLQDSLLKVTTEGYDFKYLKVKTISSISGDKFRVEMITYLDVNTPSSTLEFLLRTS